MKKWVLGLITLISFVQVSSVLAEQTKKEVRIPCYNGGFSFGLAGLYLRPSVPHLDYAVTFPSIENLTTFNSGQFQSSGPEFEWGYSANVGYMFPGTATEIRLTYTRLNTDESRDFFRDDSTEVINIAGGDLDTVSDTHLNSRVSFDYHALDLELAQSIQMGCSFKVRYFGGVRYADLDHDFDISFFQGDSPFLINRINEVISRQSSEYWGVGPRFGAEGSYAFGCGFGMIGQIATSLLVGEIDSRHAEETNFTLQTLVLDETSRAHYPNEIRVVPNIDAHLGFDYRYHFCNYSRTTLSVEAGYQVIHYFNTVERFASNQIDEPVWRGRQVLDTTFDGPYVGVQVKV